MFRWNAIRINVILSLYTTKSQNCNVKIESLSFEITSSRPRFARSSPEISSCRNVGTPNVQPTRLRNRNFENNAARRISRSLSLSPTFSRQFRLSKRQTLPAPRSARGISARNEGKKASSGTSSSSSSSNSSGERRRAAAALLNRQRRIPWRGDKGVRRGMEKREEEEEEERAPRASGASSAASSIYPWWVPPVPSPPVSFALCLRQEGEEGVVSRGERASRVRASGEVSRT